MAFSWSSEVFLLNVAFILDPCFQCSMLCAVSVGLSVSFSPFPRCHICGRKKWALSQTGKLEVAGERLRQAAPGQEKSTNPQLAGCSCNCPWQRGHIFPAAPALIFTPACFLEDRTGGGRSFALISEFNAWGRVFPRSGEKKEGGYCPSSPKTIGIFIWIHKTHFDYMCRKFLC